MLSRFREKHAALFSAILTSAVLRPYRKLNSGRIGDAAQPKWAHPPVCAETYGPPFLIYVNDLADNEASQKHNDRNAVNTRGRCHVTQTSTFHPSSAASVEEAVAELRTWFITLGILLMILGCVAIAFPLITTIAVKILLGWLFLIGGIVQIVHAFSTQKWSQFFLSLLVGVLYVFVGGWLAFFPLAGIITLTILLAAMFIAQGVLEFGMAFRIRPREGWVWMLVSGIIAILVGLMIFGGLPATAAWAIGLLVGINLISSGLAYLFLALAAGRGAH